MHKREQGCSRDSDALGYLQSAIRVANTAHCSRTHNSNRSYISLILQTVSTVVPHVRCCRYQMLVCIFVGVDGENKSQVLCQALMGNEQTESFEWVLRNFLVLCGRPPEVHGRLDSCN